MKALTKSSTKSFNKALTKALTKKLNEKLNRNLNMKAEPRRPNPENRKPKTENRKPNPLTTIIIRETLEKEISFVKTFSFSAIFFREGVCTSLIFRGEEHAERLILRGFSCAFGKSEKNYKKLFISS